MQVSTMDVELIDASIINRIFTGLSPKYTYRSQKGGEYLCRKPGRCHLDLRFKSTPKAGYSDITGHMAGQGSTFVGFLPKVQTSDLIVGQDQIRGEGFSQESMSVLSTAVKAVTDCGAVPDGRRLAVGDGGGKGGD